MDTTIKVLNEEISEKIFKIWDESYSHLLKKCFNGIPELGIVNPYHEELSIYDHILMVYEYAKSNYSLDYTIQVGALMHDLGKIDTRNVKENKKVTFYNHENMGVFRALEFFDILKSEGINLSNEIKKNLIDIVAFHDIYKYDYETLKTKFKPSTLEMLCKFSECDSNGRITNEVKVTHKFENYENIKKDKDKNFVVLVGLPASGKSTYIKNNLFKDYVVISRDNFVEAKRKDGESYTECFKRLTKEEQEKIDAQYRELLLKSVNSRKNIIIDKTNTSTKSRRILLNTSKSIKMDYKVKAIVFLKDLKTIENQNKNREGKVLDNIVIENFKNAFTIPTFGDFDDIEYIF